MKLSRRVRYALRLMIDIARHGEDERPVNLSQIARSSQMPHRYLEQLVMPLRKASLVKATIGRGGGYSLGQPAGSIKIGQIVEAMTGPIQIVECIGDPQTCAGRVRTRTFFGKRPSTLSSNFGTASSKSLISRFG